MIYFFQCSIFEAESVFLEFTTNFIVTTGSIYRDTTQPNQKSFFQNCEEYIAELRSED